MPKQQKQAEFNDKQVAEAITALADEAYEVYDKKKVQYEDNWQDIPVDELTAIGKTKANMFFTSVKNKDKGENIMHHAADLLNWITFACMRGVEK